MNDPMPLTTAAFTQHRDDEAAWIALGEIVPAMDALQRLQTWLRGNGHAVPAETMGWLMQGVDRVGADVVSGGGA